jgi:LEA14-like dessication related protein
VFAGLERPTVQSVENEFGEVSQETATIQTRVVVTNPNDRTISGATIRYTIEMNGIQMATGTESGVTLEPGRNVLEFTTQLDNGKIPQWWVTHVERNETTTLTTQTTASFANLPFSVSLPPQEQTIETSFLASLQNDTGGEVELAEEPLLDISEQNASWGNATEQRTPARFRTTLTNRHERPVTMDDIAYTVRMNDVVVGSGTDDGFTLTPGETRAVTIEAAIESQRMQGWWVSHLRSNQTTRLEVDVAGVVEQEGERYRVPLAALGSRAVFRTDQLGETETVVEQLPAEEGPTVTQPTVGNATSRWGEPTDEVTPILTDVPVTNPNEEGSLTDVIRLNVSQRTTINDLEVAANDTRAPVPPGESTLQLRSEMRNDEVPVWWARHVNRGERSSVRTEVRGGADLGFTTFPRAPDDRTNTVETDMLADFNDSTAQPVTADGRTLLGVKETSARWREASSERAPIQVTLRIRNNQPRDATIRDINYTVRLNDVTLADRESPDTFTIPAGRTETVQMTMVLNNSRMADWWPSHVRRGERSTLRTEAYATVESGRQTNRVRLDAISNNRTVETDLLAG